MGSAIVAIAIGREVDEQAFRPQWQFKFQAHFDKWFGLPQCLKTYHLSLYNIKKDMLLTGPFAMLSMPSFVFHLPPCMEGFLIHLSPTMAIATLAIATVSLGGTISLCSLIAFDERVTFWLQRVRSLPCACAYVALFLRRLAYNHYAIAHAYNAANTHAQGSDPARWSQKLTLSSKEIGV